MDITDRKSAEEIQNKVRITLAEDLDHARRLQKLSTVSLADEAGDRMYEEILDSGIALMQAQFGSLQLLDEEQGELHLCASRNFHPDSAAFWRKVSMGKGTSSASAFLRGERVVVTDATDSDLVEDLKARRQYALSGIAALQSTPLVTRSGRVLGVFSTHWRDRRDPSERELAVRAPRG
ncbi:MAG TPA: GAF domain-containing protein [Polyangiaceae bacterium]|jgi:GAF domain-containing protein|nr:GAF domain-containing protein [Polyangiaceae bacterium]